MNIQNILSQSLKKIKSTRGDVTTHPRTTLNTMTTINTINRTNEFMILNKHIYFDGGAKTVCVSTCLAFFGIMPNEYVYTSSKGNVNAYENVLRRKGYSVRSRKSEFGIKKIVTMTELRRKLKSSDYTANDLFIVVGYQRKSAHLMVLNGNGETVIDTAPNSKWHISDINIVELKSNQS
jgi:hypothetical protein